MEYIDVFNGDADGICALHQLRLAEPRPGARLVTGVKRDIALLGQLKGVSGAEIAVVDISLDRNREALLSLLESCRVLYVDHHHAGELPRSENFSAHIDTDPGTCASLIVDGLLGGRFRTWALVGAFGDNLHSSARKASEGLGLSDETLDRLRELGELLNYNGYGAELADLHCHPAELYRELSAYSDPLDFYQQSPRLEGLRRGFAQDMAQARELPPVQEDAGGRVFELPAAAWSRRVAGVFANELARQAPDKAHALLVADGKGSFLVSVRAPRQRPTGADILCRAFPSGGGRAAAAGINALPEAMRARFMREFSTSFSQATNP